MKRSALVRFYQQFQQFGKVKRLRAVTEYCTARLSELSAAKSDGNQ